jgi:hypothetical protein
VNDTGRFNLGIGIDMSSGSADEAADRALSSVARKLDKSLSVESTVNELIAEAIDPMNLATIFHGELVRRLCMQKLIVLSKGGARICNVISTP